MSEVQNKKILEIIEKVWAIVGSLIAVGVFNGIPFVEQIFTNEVAEIVVRLISAAIAIWQVIRGIVTKKVDVPVGTLSYENMNPPIWHLINPFRPRREVA